MADCNLTPYPHQLRAEAWQDANPKGWLAMEQGTGKTAPTIRRLVFPAFVVVPAFLTHNWLNEFAMWRPRCRISVNQVDKRADVNLISYNRFAALPSVVPCETLVLDEAHYAKNWKAKRTKVAAQWVRRTPRARLLTGTPMPARPIDFWPMAFAMGATKLTWREWGFRYCNGHIGLWGGYDFSGASRLDELAQLLAPWMFRLLKSEVLSLPGKLRRIVALDSPLGPEDRDFSADEILAHPNPLSFIGLSEAMRIHGERKVPAALSYILDVLESEPSAVIFARHHSVIDALLQGLHKEKIPAASITGHVRDMDKRNAIVRDFQAGKLRALVGNIEAMGVGLTLTRSRYGIMVESSWSYAANVQAEDRLDRIGQLLPVQIDYLAVDRSLDHAVVKRMLEKRDVADTVLDRDRRLLAELIP